MAKAVTDGAVITPAPQQFSGESVTAAATMIDLDDKKAAAALKKRRAAWQEEAWKYYDDIGEIWFANEFVGNALRRIRIFPAYQPDPEQPPVPVDADKIPEGTERISEELATRAKVEVDRLSQGDGVGAILHRLGVNLGVPGDSYLVGIKNDDGTEKWASYSPDQVSTNDKDEVVLLSAPGDKDGIVLGATNATLVRIWRPHPRWSNHATSPMRAVLDQCDELQILSRHIRSAGRSRIASSGVWLVPKEVSFGPVEPALDDETGGNGAARRDPLMQDLLEHMTTPIADEGVAAAVVPMIVRSPAEYIEKFKHIVFERPLDPVAAEQRKELIIRIASGLDIPAEVLLGLADSNHWSAWQIDEQTFKAHIEPLVIMICNAITVGFLRPALGAGGERVQLWYDAGGLLGHPNRAQDAKDAHTAIVISDEAYRKYLGFPDEDAPDQEEIDRRVAQAAAMKPAMGQSAPVDAAGTDKSPPADSGQASVLASGARAAAQGPGWRLAQIDRDLRTRLLAAADQVMFAGLEKAGAKLRRKVGRNSELQALIKEVPQHLVAFRLGQAVVHDTMGFDDHSLTSGIADPLQEKYEIWVARAQRQARAVLAADETPESDLDWAAIEAKQKEDREAGWVVLSGLMATQATKLLFDPAPEFPANGEFDGTTRVAPGIIREALSRAGGATGPSVPGGGVLDGNLQPTGGVSTGQTMRDLFVSVGRLFDGFVWIYGDPSSRDRNYDPHLELDGLEFSSWTDTQLLSSEEWPPEEYFFPGDHLYCQCDFALIEVQAASEEAA